MKESAVETHLARECKRRGVLCLKLALLGGRGWPDRTLFARPGRVAFLELKRPGKRPNPLQDWVIRTLREYGFRVGWTDTKAGVDAYLAEWLGAP